MDSIIEVENLTKQYGRGTGTPVYLSLRDTIANFFANLFKPSTKTTDTTFTALNELSFNAQKGEIIGVIGPNGAGKSTLLKTLSRITAPTSGTVKLRGKVSSLLDVGVGFHMELSGRENIYLNGVILGMSRKEIDEKLKEIIDFSGLTEFIDQPVKQYSTGMFVRLGFSIAVHLDTDILILDEVLSVGDLDFQQKSLRKMRELLTSKNITIIVVSHDLVLLEQLCHKILFLAHGKKIAFGQPKEVIEQYRQYVQSNQN